MRLRSVLVFLVISLFVLPLVACGGDAKLTDTSAAGAQTTATAAAPAGPKVSQVAPQAMLDAIAAAAKKGKVVRPLTGQVISSATAGNVYYAAIEFSSSTENFVGLWATDKVDGTGTFWAINSVAKDNTTFAKGSDANPKIAEDDASAKEALAKYGK